MGNSLIMKTEANISLNFLIYIQNIFLNQTDERLRFPYISSEVTFVEDFKMEYKMLWNEVSQRIAEQPVNDLIIFNKEKDVLYRRLFVESNENLKGLNMINQSFEIWWDSFAGRFSIEKSIDEKGRKLYEELANVLVRNKIKPQRELNISLIYDECLLADTGVISYFAVLSLKDMFLKNNETLLELKACIAETI